MKQKYLSKKLERNIIIVKLLKEVINILKHINNNEGIIGDFLLQIVFPVFALGILALIILPLFCNKSSIVGSNSQTKLQETQNKKNNIKITVAEKKIVPKTSQKVIDKSKKKSTKFEVYVKKKENELIIGFYIVFILGLIQVKRYKTFIKKVIAN